MSDMGYASQNASDPGAAAPAVRLGLFGASAPGSSLQFSGQAMNPIALEMLRRAGYGGGAGYSLTPQGLQQVAQQWGGQARSTLGDTLKTIGQFVGALS
jgi:hypothetical protein